MEQILFGGRDLDGGDEETREARPEGLDACEGCPVPYGQQDAEQTEDAWVFFEEWLSEGDEVCDDIFYHAAGVGRACASCLD